MGLKKETNGEKRKKKKKTAAGYEKRNRTEVFLKKKGGQQYKMIKRLKKKGMTMRNKEKGGVEYGEQTCTTMCSSSCYLLYNFAKLQQQPDSRQLPTPFTFPSFVLEYYQTNMEE